MKAKDVIGLDFSITSTGVCVMSVTGGVRSLFSIKTKPCKLLSWDDQRRFAVIRDEILIAMNKYKTDYLFIEAPAFAAYDNEGRLYQLKGTYLMSLFEAGYRYPVYVAPSKLKKFIMGKGNLAKDLMGDHVRKTYAKELLNVSFKNDDEIDAFALAKFGQVLIRTKLGLTKMNALPVYQRESLKGVTLNGFSKRTKN